MTKSSGPAEVQVGEITRFTDAELRARVDARLREIGYRCVTLDLRGFRSGSLNEVLTDRARRDLSPQNPVCATFLNTSRRTVVMFCDFLRMRVIGAAANPGKKAATRSASPSS